MRSARGGGAGWATAYPAGAPKQLPGQVPLPAGALVSDAAVTAFLGDAPAGPTELSVAVVPPRLRAGPGARRELLARLLAAVLRLTEDDEARLYVHAEPGLTALLLYAAVRLLPRLDVSELTFTTFEPYHRNIRNYKLARVVGTYLGADGKGLEGDLATGRNLALDTFDPARSSPDLRQTLADLLPARAADLIKLAARGGWATLDEIHAKTGGQWNARGWVAEAGQAARAAGQPTALPPPPPAPPPAAHAPAAAPAAAEPLAAAAPSAAAAKPASPPLPPSRPVGGMTYSAPISRTNPACLLFLVDQSKSMADPFPGTGQTKAGVVADALNRLIQNVVLRSAKADGVRDYFRVGVIGYGQGVKAGLGGAVPHKVLIPVSELGTHPLRVESRTKLIPDGVGGVIEQKVKFPVWFDAEASGQTPMCEALAAAGLAVKGFVDEFPDAFPPIVLNLTDGMPSDGNPQYNARLLCNMGTSDGAALLFNLLISSKPVTADYFPATEEHMADTCSKLLFRTASVLPTKMYEAAGRGPRPQAEGPRGGDQRRPDRDRAVPGHRHPRHPVGSVNPMPALQPAPQWVANTVPKRGNRPAENEDATAAAADGLRFAVADGATEGWESGPWAARLVAEYIGQPPEPATFAGWLERARQWQPPEPAGPVPWYAEEKREQGAFATLLGLELRRSRTTPGWAWRAVAVGDSCLFHVRGAKPLQAVPLSSRKQFGSRPPLVPSAAGRPCPEPGWFAGRAEPGDLFLLATDAACSPRKCSPRPWSPLAPHYTGLR